MAPVAKRLTISLAGSTSSTGIALAGVDLEFEQAAQRHVAAALVIDDLGVFLVGVPVVGAGAVLQLGNRVGAPHVLLAAGAPGVFAAGVQHGGQHRVVTKRRLVHADGFLGNLEDTDAFDPARRAGEVLGHRGAVEANGFEQLRAAVAHVGAHAHLGHDLRQALADRLDVVVDGFLGGQVAGQVLVDRRQGFHRQVGVHGFGAVTGQHTKVVHFARGAGFHHQTGGGAQAFAHQVLVNGRQGQQRGNRHLGGADGAVADDQDVLAALDRVHRFGAQRGQLGLHTLLAPEQRVGDVERDAAELAVGVPLDVAQLGHVGEVQDRLAHFQPHRRVDLVDVEQVGLGADEGHQRHHDGFADRVDRRVRHLREQLLEVVVERLVAVAQHGQRAVVAHRSDGLLAGLRHGCQQELDVFLGGAEGLLAVQQAHRALGRAGGFAVLLEVVEPDAQVLDPLLVGLAVGEVGLEFLVVDHAALFQVDQEHLAGLQAPLAHDLGVRHRQHAGSEPMMTRSSSVMQ
jgi:hypothetical protein